MKKIYLINKIGAGDKRFLNELYSEEILPCEEQKLKKDIVIKTTIYDEKNNKKEQFKNFWKNDICIFKYGELLDTKINIQKNYLIYENMEEAIQEKIRLIELLKENLIEKQNREITIFIEDLKNNIKIVEIN